MNKVVFKQIKPLKPKIFGALLIALVLYTLIFYSEFSIKSFIILLIGVAIISYSVTYVIDKDFKNYKYLKVLGIKMPDEKLMLDFPDYISVTPLSLKQNNDWGAVSSLGKAIEHEKIAIKIFKKNKHFTVFKTKDYKEAINKAKQLSEMLDVRLVDKIKNSST